MENICFIYLEMVYIYIHKYIENGPNGKRKRPTSFCLLQTETENESLFS